MPYTKQNLDDGEVGPGDLWTLEELCTPDSRFPQEKEELRPVAQAALPESVNLVSLSFPSIGISEEVAKSQNFNSQER